VSGTRVCTAGRHHKRLRGTGPMLAIALPGLAGCAAVFVLAPHDELLSPLTIALAACAVIGTYVSLDFEGTLFWDGSFLPIACAVALLGPAPVAAITALSELSVFRIERYRPRVFALNLFGTVAPNMAAALMIEAVAGDPPGFGFYAIFALIISLAIIANVLVITALAGVLYDEPVLKRMRNHSRYSSAIAINVVLAIAAVAIYQNEGLVATLFVIACVFVFAYVAKRLAAERDQRAQIEELATSRGLLVAQLLETEDRERKAMAQALHDDVVQTLLVARQDLQEAEAGDSGRVRSALEHLDDAVQRVRGRISVTHPSVLQRVGLRAALATIAEEAAARGRFVVEVFGDETRAGMHDRLVFSAARELLANAAKHSRGDRVQVDLSVTDRETVLVVTDDGIGFEPNLQPTALQEGHIGLQSISERVAAVGGCLKISSSPGYGTTATVRLPTTAAKERTASREPRGDDHSGAKLASVSED
jgi:signal transduction histidine kinase